MICIVVVVVSGMVWMMDNNKNMVYGMVDGRLRLLEILKKMKELVNIFFYQ